MAYQSKYKRVKKGSSFKYVEKYTDSDGGVMWYARLRNTKTSMSGGKVCQTEHEAAKSVDLYLIGIGKEPVNVLKRK